MNKNNKCNQCKKEISLMRRGINTKINKREVLLCANCYNEITADKMELDFKTIEPKPVQLRDCVGKLHKFHFFPYLGPSGFSIEAYEIIDDEIKGYNFSILGSHDCDQSNLILDLYEKIKAGISEKYLQNRNNRKSIKNMSVVGRIRSDLDCDGEVPELYIDGERVTWYEFGKMLMTFEGFQFKIDIIDPSDKVEVKGVSKKDDNFSPEALKLWTAIPVEFRKKVLDNVWCPQCGGGVTICDYKGVVEKGMLVLRGCCFLCGHKVARVLEGQ